MEQHGSRKGFRSQLGREGVGASNGASRASDPAGGDQISWLELIVRIYADANAAGRSGKLPAPNGYPSASGTPARNHSSPPNDGDRDGEGYEDERRGGTSESDMDTGGMAGREYA